jgi:hypothetical protein
VTRVLAAAGAVTGTEPEVRKVTAGLREGRVSTLHYVSM